DERENRKIIEFDGEGFIEYIEAILVIKDDKEKEDAALKVIADGEDIIDIVVNTESSFRNQSVKFNGTPTHDGHIGSQTIPIKKSVNTNSDNRIDIRSNRIPIVFYESLVLEAKTLPTTEGNSNTESSLKLHGGVKG